MVNKTPESLVKFCSVSSAKNILATQSLRWSAPHLFNDPLEAKAEQALSFTEQDMLNATVRHTLKLLFGTEDPNGNTPILHAIKRWRSENRFDSSDEADQILRGLLEQLVTTRQQHIDEKMQQWRSYCGQLRICCFSAKAANPYAWQYLADNHRGVALAFSGGVFDHAQAVRYSDTRPEILELAQQIAAVMENTTEAFETDFNEQFLIKPVARKFEMEWRCLQQIDQASTGEDFIDQKFAPDQLTAIYLGLGTPAAEKTSLSQLAKQVNPRVKIFSAEAKASELNPRFKNTGKKRRPNSVTKARPADAMPPSQSAL